MPAMPPADVEFVETATCKIRTELHLSQAPRTVWNVLADNERRPEWFAACKAARSISEPPHGVGSTRWVQVDQLEVNERFVAWDEPERWGFTILDANIPLAETVVELITLRQDGDGTQLRHDVTAELQPWAKPLAPVLRWRFTRMFANSRAGLRPDLDAEAS